MTIIKTGANDGQGNGRNVKELYVLEVVRIEFLNRKDNVLLPGGLVLAADAELLGVDFANNTCVFTEGQEDTANGMLYRPQLSFEVPGTGAFATDYFYRVRYKKLAALFRDANGVWWLALPLWVNMGRAVGSKIFVPFLLSGPSAHPVLRLGDTSLDDILANAEFSGDFSVDFNS